jgi:hypothetical protein
MIAISARVIPVSSSPHVNRRIEHSKSGRDATADIASDDREEPAQRVARDARFGQAEWAS